jgi:hypothetical protein
MIDSETGYNDEVVCECIACERCDGEGSGVNYCDVLDPAPACRQAECRGHNWACTHCNAAGRDRDDCPVHSDPSGVAFKGGVCCTRFDLMGKHDPSCGNYVDMPLRHPERARKIWEGVR